MAGVRKLANCDLDLTSFDLSSCKRKKIRGKHHVRIEYEIQIYFGSKKGVLDFLGVYNGAEVGRLSVKFDGQGSEGVNGVHGNGEKAIESCGVM